MWVCIWLDSVVYVLVSYGSWLQYLRCERPAIRYGNNAKPWEYAFIVNSVPLNTICTLYVYTYVAYTRTCLTCINEECLAIYLARSIYIETNGDFAVEKNGSSREIAEDEYEEKEKEKEEVLHEVIGLIICIS